MKRGRGRERRERERDVYRKKEPAIYTNIKRERSRESEGEICRDPSSIYKFIFVAVIAYSASIMIKPIMSFDYKCI